MNGEQLSMALRAGKRVYGSLVVSTSPHWPAAVKATGVDFVFIDTEHIAIDRTRLAWMCQTFRALELAPVVRIPAPDPYQACVALDNGAAGVLAPYIETPEQVRRLSGAVKFRPLKGAVLEGILEGNRKMEAGLAAYIRRRNAGNVLMINIESTPALEALEDVLRVPGIDAVLVGPHDLSTSLGVPEQYLHAVFEEAVRTIIRKTAAQGIGVGVHYWESIEQEIEWAKLGANLIVHSSDITLFTRSLRADLSRIREALGEGSGEAGSAPTGLSI